MITFVIINFNLITMLNLDDFVKRLEIVMDFYSLSGGSFADKIGIQRSSLSHLLSGRNKPSLEFVMKIVSVLPEVDLDWILNGKGVFPKSSQKATQIIVETKPIATPKLLFDDDVSDPETKKIPETKQEDAPKVSDNLIVDTVQEHKSNVVIENIVVFYTDGTFLDYKKSKRTV